MEKLLIENSDELQQLQNRMNYLMIEWERQDRVIEKIQRHTGRDENIFSPRTANEINEEKIQAEKKKGDSIKQEIECVREKIESLLVKQEEYENVLKGLKKHDDSSSENEEGEIGKEIGKEIEKIIKNVMNAPENIKNQNEAKDQDDINEYDTVINLDDDYAKSQDDIEGKSDTKNKEEIYDQKHNDVLPELEMKLTDISKMVDIALALLNGDKNKCKNELKKVKKELKECIDKIK